MCNICKIGAVLLTCLSAVALGWAIIVYITRGK